MDIITYVLSKAYTDKKSSDFAVSIEASIDEIQAELTAFKTAMASGMLYKGSVEAESELPTGDSVKVGDVYTVKADGIEYVWDGTEWLTLGDDQLDDKLATKQDKLTAGTNITISEDDTISSKQEVIVAATVDDFPEVGQDGTLYISSGTQQLYIWDDASQGYATTKIELSAVSSSSDSTTILDGGTATTSALI